MSKARQPRLGRGLSALMARPVGISAEDDQKTSASAALAVPADSDSAERPDGGVEHLPVEAIRPNPGQPRQSFDERTLQELADSLRQVGMMQPIIVRRNETEDTYELVAGERRWRAAGLAGLDRVPCIVRDLDDRETAQWALIENIQREDLNPIDRARGFASLIDQFELSHEQAATHLGVDRTTITNGLRLLQLHPDVQELAVRGAITNGVAKVLAGIADSEVQVLLARQAIQRGWSVRQVEAAARNIKSESKEGDPAPKSARSRHLADLENQIAEQLQTKVHIRPGRKKGTGSLTIDFYSIDQFDTLMSRLGVETE
ncbi:MAG: chromosome partitioning protein ParB [Phycisphaeraceae bacterium]|nr:chromosome partitioning protein ParB [Phycisphaeraceae bacterium]